MKNDELLLLEVLSIQDYQLVFFFQCIMYHAHTIGLSIRRHSRKKIVWRRETEYSRIGHLQENYIPFLLQGLCVMLDKDNLMYLSTWFFPHEEWMRSLTWRFCPRNLGMYLLLYNSNLIYNLVYFYVHSMWH